jgi:hypothetical protein
MRCCWEIGVILVIQAVNNDCFFRKNTFFFTKQEVLKKNGKTGF